MRFEFATATRIIFGVGVLKDIASIASEFGKKALLVTGKDAARASALSAILFGAGLESILFQVNAEPDIATVQRAVETARENLCDMVIGFGGGSAIDTGKATAALVLNKGNVLDYLEVVGKGIKLNESPLPYIAIPTTSGTGAEVTKNAVISSPEHNVKVSLRSSMMFPKVALVDPELTISMPPDVTAVTGLDALTQLMEPFVSRLANPLVDSLCRDGLSRVARSLRMAFEDGNDIKAREDMSVASLFGGIALANAGLGAVHGFAGPLGGMLSAPHGALCAALLPHVMEVNIDALKKRTPSSEALRKYNEIAKLLTGDCLASSADGISWVVDVCRHFGIKPLSSYGLTVEMLPVLIEKASTASSMKGNPIKLTEEEMSEAIRNAMHLA